MNNNKIRFASVADYSAMLEIYAPYIEETTISFEYIVPSIEQFTQRLNSLNDDFPVLVYESDGEIVGFAYGAPAFERKAYCWSADLSIYVRQDMRGNGIGKQLVQRILSILKAQNYRKVYSLITGENEASLAFHKALGFTFSAEFKEQGYKFGRWVSVVWLEYELNGRQVGQAFPLKLSELDNLNNLLKT